MSKREPRHVTGAFYRILSKRGIHSSDTLPDASDARVVVVHKLLVCDAEASTGSFPAVAAQDCVSLITAYTLGFEVVNVVEKFYVWSSHRSVPTKQSLYALEPLQYLWQRPYTLVKGRLTHHLMFMALDAVS